MKKLPQGWAFTNIEKISIKGAQRTPLENEYIKYVDIGSIDRKSKKIVEPQFLQGKDAPSRARKIINTNDVLVSLTRPNLNAVALIDQELNNQFASTGFEVIKSVGVESRFIFFLTRTKDFIEEISGATKGALYPAAKSEDVRKFEFALPPINEQIRIADKLDSVLAKVDAAQARLEKIPTLLKRFRQSVLAAATSGELTREWRDTYDIRFEKWSWKKLSDIADIQGGVTKDAKKQSDQDEEIPYLRVANVQRGYLDLTEIKTIRIPSVKLEKLLLKTGDVLFNEGGDLDKLGRGWVWENQISRCSFQNHVFRASLYDPNNEPKYVSWWGNTEGHEYFIRQGKQTTNLASINKTILSNLPINMPPPEEQKEIVRRVESLFAQADAVEKQYRAAKQRLDRLSQALLAKAFRGELVPQDPTDEPAAELLKRIQAERTALTPARRQRQQPV